MFLHYTHVETRTVRKTLSCSAHRGRCIIIVCESFRTNNIITVDGMIYFFPIEKIRRDRTRYPEQCLRRTRVTAHTRHRALQHGNHERN